MKHIANARQRTCMALLATLALLLSLSACGSGAVGGDDGLSSADSVDSSGSGKPTFTYTIVGTNQTSCFDAAGAAVDCKGTGQDAERTANAPDYTEDGDGTVTDNVTGVMWQQSADTNGDGIIDVKDKYTQADAVPYCQGLTLGGHSDWELPDIKTMYSLIDFSGEDASGVEGDDTSGLDPFVNDKVFGFGYGDTSADERIIDAQWATTSIYVASSVMIFGVNFADGRIKGYGDPTGRTPNHKLFYVQCVRNKGKYGVNSFSANGDGTITDKATGLMWQEADNGEAIGWDEALARCNAATTSGHNDWRLPNAKELQSLVDYARSPDTTGFAAIDPLFEATSFTNEAGQADYGFYWSSTTHKVPSGKNSAAVYLSFGRALGYNKSEWRDVHGAGAQRSDPKDISKVIAGKGGYKSVTAHGGTALIRGPQGDVVRGLNYARCVRDAM